MRKILAAILSFSLLIGNSLTVDARPLPQYGCMTEQLGNEKIDLDSIIFHEEDPIVEEPQVIEEVVEPEMEEPVEEVIVEELTEEDIKEIQYYDSLEALVVVCMAEAEGESELGKRLVIDTVLNRVDSERFPNTVYDVIYQKGQFSSMWNGRSNRVNPGQEYYDLVAEEIENRTDCNVLYFTAGNYSKYGTPYLQEGHHYFSK